MLWIHIMSKENRSIHEFDFNLISEYFSFIERQRPGRPDFTMKALIFNDQLIDDSRIADISCGTGRQIIVLTEHAPGFTTGLELFPAFIDHFDRNTSQRDLRTE